MATKLLVPRLSSTILVLAKAPPSAFTVSGNAYKLLFIQRSQSSGFMANAHVFPGGLLDDLDSKPEWNKMQADLKQSFSDKHDQSHLRICALRELFEETGLLLARKSSSSSTSSASSSVASVHHFPNRETQGRAQAASSANASTFLDYLLTNELQLEHEKLRYWSRWITPTFEKRRYDTAFYLVALNEVYNELHADPKEVASSCWLSPAEALSLAEQHKIVLPPPTTYLLKEIAEFQTIEQILEATSPTAETKHKVQTVFPVMIPTPPAASGETDPNLHIVLPGDPCYPPAALKARTAEEHYAASEGATLLKYEDAASLPRDALNTCKWHRMVRSTNPKKTVTTIFRPTEFRSSFVTKAPAKL